MSDSGVQQIQYNRLYNPYINKKILNLRRMTVTVTPVTERYAAAAAAAGPPAGAAGGRPVPAGLGPPQPETVLPSDSEFATSRPGARAGGRTVTHAFKFGAAHRRPPGRRGCSHRAGGDAMTPAAASARV